MRSSIKLALSEYQKSTPKRGTTAQLFHNYVTTYSSKPPLLLLLPPCFDAYNFDFDSSRSFAELSQVFYLVRS